MKKISNYLSIALLASVILNFVISLIIYFNTSNPDATKIYYNKYILITCVVLIIINIVLDYINFYKNTAKNKKIVTGILLIGAVLIGIGLCLTNKVYGMIMAEESFDQITKLGYIIAALVWIFAIMLIVNNGIIKKNVANNINKRYMTYVLMVLFTITYFLVDECTKNPEKLIGTVIGGILMYALSFFAIAQMPKAVLDSLFYESNKKYEREQYLKKKGLK